MSSLSGSDIQTVLHFNDPVSAIGTLEQAVEDIFEEDLCNLVLDLNFKNLEADSGGDIEEDLGKYQPTPNEDSNRTLEEKTTHGRFGSDGMAMTVGRPPKWVDQLVKVFRQAPPFHDVSSDILQRALWYRLKSFPSPSDREVRSLLRIVRSSTNGKTFLVPNIANRMLNTGSKNKGPELSVRSNVAESCEVVLVVPRTVGNTKQVSDAMDSEKTAVEKKEGKRGPYNCGRCGVPKKGHNCPYGPKKKRKNIDLSVETLEDPKQPSDELLAEKKYKRGEGAKASYRCGACGKWKKFHICQEVEVQLPHLGEDPVMREVFRTPSLERVGGSRSVSPTVITDEEQSPSAPSEDDAFPSFQHGTGEDIGDDPSVYEV